MSNRNTLMIRKDLKNEICGATWDDKNCHSMACHVLEGHCTGRKASLAYWYDPLNQKIGMTIEQYLMILSTTSFIVSISANHHFSSIMMMASKGENTIFTWTK